MDKLYVIKIGGNIIDDAQKLSAFATAFAAIHEKKILVHGGGKLATRLAEQLGIPQQLIDGRRVTGADTLKIVTMVYAGFVNKNLVAQLQSAGCNALGLSGADGNMVKAHKRIHADTDYGFAGDVDEVNSELIRQLLRQGLTPVLAPLTHDGSGQLLNTNADTIAQELAKAMTKTYDVVLIYCFEREGVLDHEESLIPAIDGDSYRELKERKIVSAGMIPKLDNAFAALEQGVRSVIIGNAEKLAALINGQSGTRIE